MSDGGSGGQTTNAVKRLLSNPTDPVNNVSQNEVDRLKTSSHIVRRNYYTITQAAEDIRTQGNLLVDQSTPRESAKAEVYTILHNYLNSLYAFNDQAVMLIDRHVNESVNGRDLAPYPTDTGAIGYAKKAVFLRGLRNEFVHGEYKSLEFVFRGTDDGRDIYHLEFDEGTFKSRAVLSRYRQPSTYLGFLDRRTGMFRYPIVYIANFHNGYFNDFSQDCITWLQSGV